MAEKRERRFFDKARDTYDSATEKLSEAKDKTKETIQNHPFASIAIAALVGAVAGVLTAETIRMMRRRR
jgi:ElaB/YqjD/DUF883 family membrane-anchored ribosome-binding protein